MYNNNNNNNRSRKPMMKKKGKARASSSVYGDEVDFNGLDEELDISSSSSSSRHARGGRRVRFQDQNRGKKELSMVEEQRLAQRANYRPPSKALPATKMNRYDNGAVLEPGDDNDFYNPAGQNPHVSQSKDESYRDILKQMGFSDGEEFIAGGDGYDDGSYLSSASNSRSSNQRLQRRSNNVVIAQGRANHSASALRQDLQESMMNQKGMFKNGDKVDQFMARMLEQDRQFYQKKQQEQQRQQQQQQQQRQQYQYQQQQQQQQQQRRVQYQQPPPQPQQRQFIQSYQPQQPQQRYYQPVAAPPQQNYYQPPTQNAAPVSYHHPPPQQQQQQYSQTSISVNNSGSGGGGGSFLDAISSYK